MNININLKDRNGNNLELGDEIELYDWGRDAKFLGKAILEWDATEGRISCDPPIVADAYDFFSKAIPRCQKVTAGLSGVSGPQGVVGQGMPSIWQELTENDPSIAENTDPITPKENWDEVEYTIEYSDSMDLINAVNKTGEMLKEIGSNVRLEIENTEHDGFEIGILTRITDGETVRLVFEYDYQTLDAMFKVSESLVEIGADVTLEIDDGEHDGFEVCRLKKTHD